MGGNFLQYIQTNIIPYSVSDNKTNKDYENFKSLRKQIENKLDNINYCSNPVYKITVFIILLGILIYFIWFVTRKQYDDTTNAADLVSTPFAESK